MYMKDIKNAVFNLIREDDQNSFASNVFDGCIIGFIVINVALIILDTFNGFSPQALVVFNVIETVSVVIFTIEYALRIWVADFRYPDLPPARARLKYITSFLALIDLLGILPFYIPFILPINLGILRLLRLFRMLRIFKTSRYTDALTTVGTVIKNKASQLLSSMMVVFVLMLIASVLMYNIETTAQPEVFQNAFSGFWWAMATITTVGYGDIYPITVLGKFLSTVIALLGIGFVAIPTGIISAGFTEQYKKEEAAKIKRRGKHYCPYCGEKLD